MSEINTHIVPEIVARTIERKTATRAAVPAVGDKTKTHSDEGYPYTQDDPFGEGPKEKTTPACYCYLCDQQVCDICQGTEKDPSGKDSHEPGAKLDHGKIRPSLIFSAMPRALIEVARVGTCGANKYTDGGWQYVDDGINRYTDAMDRHRLKEFTEGPLDLDFLNSQGVEIFHAAQIAWNALARLELMLREPALPANN